MRPVAILVAVGVSADGFREILGVAEDAKEDEDSWTAFLRHLKRRGLKVVRLVSSDKCFGLMNALGVTFPGAMWQRCVVHFCRNVFTAGDPGSYPDGRTARWGTFLQRPRP